MTDAATPTIGHAVPEPGDFCICLRCAGICCFDMLMHMSLPAPGAWEAFRFERPETWAKAEVMRAMIRRMAGSGAWIPDRTAGNA